MAAATDPFVRLWSEMVLIEAFWNDLAAVRPRVAAFASWTTKIGGPSFASWARFERGRVQAWIDQPPDYQAAITSYTEGLALARTGGDGGSENNCLMGLAMVNLAIGSPAASSTSREALTALREMRSWNRVWLLVEAINGWLSDLERLEEAAVVHGHLEAHHPAWGDSSRQARAEVAEKVGHLERAAELLAMGAAMSNEDVVVYLLERI